MCSCPTDDFADDIKTLSRYKVREAMLPVDRVKDFIDESRIFSKRLIELCPVKVGDKIIIKTSQGENHGHIEGIFVNCKDGMWEISVDTYNGLISFKRLMKTDDGWYVEVER